MPLPKIYELFALSKEQSTLQNLTSTAVTTTSNWMKSIPKSAFTSAFTKYGFLRLPYGLSQGPYFFIHLIYDLFGLDKTSDKSQGSGYLAYLDDILIYIKTETEHLEILNSAFKCLSKAGLKIKLSKCSFFKEQTHYLSHLVSGTSILQLLGKIEALMKLHPQSI